MFVWSQSTNLIINPPYDGGFLCQNLNIIKGYNHLIICYKAGVCHRNSVQLGFVEIKFDTMYFEVNVWKECIYRHFLTDYQCIRNKLKEFRHKRERCFF